MRFGLGGQACMSVGIAARSSFATLFSPDVACSRGGKSAGCTEARGVPSCVARNGHGGPAEEGLTGMPPCSDCPIIRVLSISSSFACPVLSRPSHVVRDKSGDVDRAKTSSSLHTRSSANPWPTGAEFSGRAETLGRSVRRRATTISKPGRPVGAQERCGGGGDCSVRRGRKGARKGTKRRGETVEK